MKVKIEVELEINLDGDLTPDGIAHIANGRSIEHLMAGCAKEAIDRALQDGENNGFTHELEEEATIEILSSRVVKDDAPETPRENDPGLLMNIFGGSPDQSGGMEESDSGIKSARECLEYLLDSELTSYEESEESPEHIYKRAEDGLRWINGISGENPEPKEK